MLGAADTVGTSINDGGTVAGASLDSSGHVHGFVRATDGVITIFDASGSVYTNPVSINRAGAVTGSYQDSSQAWHGFVRAVEGAITTFYAPTATSTFASGAMTPVRLQVTTLMIGHENMDLFDRHKE